ncbi:hypothetical protein M3Y97_00965400 [Aphelenchoides bicaudatus]|nr:hypothetical protein M3Y97_00965400 [Aphelenchoides bicaudatus]
MPDDTSTDSSASTEEGTSKVVVNIPVRPAPPKISKIPPHPDEDQPPPYSSSHHAQASGLLSSSKTVTRTPEQEANNRTRSPPGYRKYTQYLTKRNLLILAGIILLLFAITAVLVLLSGSDDSDSEDYYAPTLGPPAAGKAPVKDLEVKWKLLGSFTEHEQRMSFDETTDAIYLSKYFPDEHILKSEKLEVDASHKKYISSSHNISQIYQDCIRFTDEVICCSTSPHGHNHKTECYLNIDNQIIKSSAAHYDFQHNWQGLNDDRLLILFNKQHHAVLNLKTKRVQKIEENRLPHGYISIAFFFPMDNADELDELVRNRDDFRICEYKQTLSGDYALQAPECRTTPFHVEFELPKVRFCSNPIYTAVVQYGHLPDERDLTFHLKLVFDNSAEIYTARDSLESSYDQVVMDCNDETLEIYAMGAYEIARFTVKLPNLHSERYIQNRL